MLKEKDLFDSDYNRTGKGLKHKYEKIERDGIKLVRGQTTGLTWQQSGSEDHITLCKSQNLVQKLNSEKHAGFDELASAPSKKPCRSWKRKRGRLVHRAYL